MKEDNHLKKKKKPSILRGAKFVCQTQEELQPSTKGCYNVNNKEVMLFFPSFVS